MVKTDVIIVGGGPAGSACAWQLKKNGIDCIVIDQHEFPRLKPCAGWITPEVLKDLAFTPSDYPHGLTTFKSFEITLKKIHFRMRTKQHAIRRIEFDDWLLRRSGAAIYKHAVKKVIPTGDGYRIDQDFWGKYVIGAGGTHCPVYKSLFANQQPKDKAALIVAQEEEFQYPYTDPRCYLWFLQDRLPGYAWYVPKANGYVNVGVGGKAGQLSENGDSLKRHWKILEEKLYQMGLVCGYTYKPAGHSYYLKPNRKHVIRLGNALLVGDSAGLATLDMGEGISPSIRSGLRAADSIIHGIPYTLGGIHSYSIFSLLMHSILP